MTVTPVSMLPACLRNSATRGSSGHPPCRGGDPKLELQRRGIPSSGSTRVNAWWATSVNQCSRTKPSRDLVVGRSLRRPNEAALGTNAHGRHPDGVAFRFR